METLRLLLKMQFIKNSTVLLEKKTKQHRVVKDYFRRPS